MNHIQKKPRTDNTIQMSQTSNSCECGIGGHHEERECFKNECRCCLNFHERSGAKA